MSENRKFSAEEARRDLASRHSLIEGEKDPLTKGDTAVTKAICHDLLRISKDLEQLHELSDADAVRTVTVYSIAHASGGKNHFLDRYRLFLYRIKDFYEEPVVMIAFVMIAFPSKVFGCLTECEWVFLFVWITAHTEVLLSRAVRAVVAAPLSHEILGRSEIFLAAVILLSTKLTLLANWSQQLIRSTDGNLFYEVYRTG